MFPDAITNFGFSAGEDEASIAARTKEYTARIGHAAPIPRAIDDFDRLWIGIALDDVRRSLETLLHPQVVGDDRELTTADLHAAWDHVDHPVNFRNPPLDLRQQTDEKLSAKAGFTWTPPYTMEPPP